MENTQQELSKGLTTEQVKAIYFNEDALVERPIPLYRIDNNGYRNYYSMDEKGNIQMYTSITTLLSKTLPTSPQIIDWIAKHGREKADQLKNEAADYGTFMHIQCASLLIAGTYDLDAVDEMMAGYIEECGHPKAIIKDWLPEIKKDILAFAQFVKETDLKALAVEITLCSKNGTAGTVDIVGELNIEEKAFYGEVYKSGENQGKPKETKRIRRITAIVDMKSGRKGFYEAHEVQLVGYKVLWEENFPTKPIEKLFNWSPKEWRTEPGYNLKDQTDSKNAAKFPHLLELAKIEEGKRDTQVSICEGIIDLKGDLTNNYRTIGLMELLKQKNDLNINK